jgi:hypothetical protein
MLYISLITVYKEKSLRMEIGVSGYLSGLCPSFATSKRTQCSGNWICLIQNNTCFVTEIFTRRQVIKSFGSSILDFVKSFVACLAYIFQPEDVCSTLLRYMYDILPDYTASHPRN